MASGRSAISQVKRVWWDLQRQAQRAPRKMDFTWRRLTARSRVLPDFMIIGAMKSGTTSLMLTLRQHPGVIMNVFNDIEYWSYRCCAKPMSAYQQYFPTAGKVRATSRRLGRPVVVGEQSHDYLPHPSAYYRIKENRPNTKFVAILRNPIDRAFSHYQHARRKSDGRETLSFEEALDREEERMHDPDGVWQYRHGRKCTHDGSKLLNFRSYGYQMLGRYAEQFEPWLATFPREQFLVLRSEDFFEDSPRIFRELEDFIGASDWLPDKFGVYKQGNYAETMKPETRERLAAYFKPHNEALADLLGRDFGWD